VEPAIDSADCRSANLSSSLGRGSGRPWPCFLLRAHVRPVTHLAACRTWRIEAPGMMAQLIRRLGGLDEQFPAV
jgi:hypothetical protein